MPIAEQRGTAVERGDGEAAGVPVDRAADDLVGVGCARRPRRAAAGAARPSQRAVPTRLPPTVFETQVRVMSSSTSSRSSSSAKEISISRSTMPVTFSVHDSAGTCGTSTRGVDPVEGRRSGCRTARRRERRRRPSGRPAGAARRRPVAPRSSRERSALKRDRSARPAEAAPPAITTNTPAVARKRRREPDPSKASTLGRGPSAGSPDHDDAWRLVRDVRGCARWSAAVAGVGRGIDGGGTGGTAEGEQRTDTGSTGGEARQDVLGRQPR